MGLANLRRTQNDDIKKIVQASQTDMLMTAAQLADDQHRLADDMRDGKQEVDTIRQTEQHESRRPPIKHSMEVVNCGDSSGSRTTRRESHHNLEEEKEKYHSVCIRCWSSGNSLATANAAS